MWEWIAKLASSMIISTCQPPTSTAAISALLLRMRSVRVRAGLDPNLDWRMEAGPRLPHPHPHPHTPSRSACHWATCHGRRRAPGLIGVGKPIPHVPRQGALRLGAHSGCARTADGAPGLALGWAGFRGVFYPHHPGGGGGGYTQRATGAIHCDQLVGVAPTESKSDT
jgi:hypothetical protein